MNLTRNQIRVSSAPVDVGEKGFAPLKDFLDMVEKIMTGFEIEHIPELEIEFSCDDYGEFPGQTMMVLSHFRQETDEEMKHRLFANLTIEAAHEKRERATLEALQKKYGATP